MPEERPNVLFLMSDQHSFRHVGFSDRETPVETPALDGLAADGTVFDATYCPVPLCTPSRMCMLSGREVQRCGAWENWLRLDPELPTLPEAFAEAGYATSLVGKMHLGGDRQFVGFEDRPYGDLTGMAGHQTEPPASWWERARTDTPKGWKGNPGHPDPHVTGIPESLLQERNVLEESLAWLREQESADADQPWFLCASFSRPHGPLTAPRRHLDEFPPEDVPMPEVWPEVLEHPAAPGEDNDREEMLTERAAYLACVEFLDEVLGDLLATLDREGFLENTVVVYLSDHGDMAGEHDAAGKCKPFEDSVRVPMVVETPAQRRGEADAHRVETPVSLLDLFPTLCGLAGVDAPDGLDGADLSDAVATGAEPDRGPVVSDYLTPSFGFPEFRMVRDGRHKFVRYRDDSYPDLLFDLAADPEETENLAPDADGEDRAALERLRAHVEESLDFGVAEAIRRRDEEELPENALPTGTRELVNAYHRPDGRVVEADTPLYHPHVITEDAERIYPDYRG
jgi:choline-sulfatase